MQAAARVLNSELWRQKTLPRIEPQQTERAVGFPNLRWLYAVHPALRPTVFVPGPVVAVRKV